MINYKPVVIFVSLLMLLATSSVSCQQNDNSPFMQIDQLLLQGENLQAWNLLQELPVTIRKTGDGLWRMARTQYELGRLSESDEKSLKYFKEAESYAREAIAINPKKSDGYKWLAIVLGAQTKYVKIKIQVQQSREIKEMIEKAIALDPDDDLSYLVLSRWHYKISALGFFARSYAGVVYGGLPEASLEEAENLLWKAIKLQDRIAHRYNLAKIYRRMDRNDDETTQLRLALLLPVTFPEEAEELIKAKEKLQP